MKKKRGRKPNETPSVRISLTGWLNPEFDADILAWLRSIPEGQRMNAFKTALRSGGMLPDNLPAEVEDDTQQAANEILGNWEF